MVNTCIQISYKNARWTSSIKDAVIAIQGVFTPDVEVKGDMHICIVELWNRNDFRSIIPDRLDSVLNRMMNQKDLEGIKIYNF